MLNYQTENFFDISKTIAADIFTEVNNVWDVLPKISEFIIKLGNTLPKKVFN